MDYTGELLSCASYGIDWFTFSAMVTVCSYSLKGVSLIIACNLAVSYIILSVNKRLNYLTNISREKQWNYLSLGFAHVDCSKLIEGDTKEEQKAAELMWHYDEMVHSVPSHLFSKARENCSDYIKQRSFITDHLTVEELDFPIAFSILVYKDITQVERLLRSVYRPQNVYCIHVDSKAAEQFRNDLASIASCFHNVFLVATSFDVVWGEFSVVQAELVCMKELLKYKWKYFINLTGQEFPLKTNRQLVNILKGFEGVNDIQGSLKRRNIHRTLSREPAPHGITLTAGSVHIAAVRGYVQFIIEDRRVRDFITWLDGTFVPDETFFSSLNHSPSLDVPGSYNGSVELMEEKASRARYKLWYPAHCNGRWQRAICIFTTADLYYMINSSKLFANKFEKNYGQVAYDCLEEWHRNKTRDEYMGLS